MKSREERERELQQLATTESGKYQLSELYRELFNIPAGQTIEPGTPLIAGILSKEYPKDSV